MKAIDVKQLDEKDEEIADALISLGMSRNAAIILAYLQDMKSSKSFDLERGANLRQPEVSIAMKELKERGWINEREEKKPGKGRPHKIYSLKIGLKEIVSRLEKQQRKAAEEASGKIHRLRELPSLSILLSQLLNPFTVSVCRIIQRIFVSVSSTIGSDEAERNNIRTPHIHSVMIRLDFINNHR